MGESHLGANLTVFIKKTDCTTSTTQTSTTPDIHHTRHPPHRTSTTPDIHHTRHPPHHNIHFPKMYIPQPCARRAHRNPPTYIHPPIVGMIYPIPTYIFN